MDRSYNDQAPRVIQRARVIRSARVTSSERQATRGPVKRYFFLLSAGCVMSSDAALNDLKERITGTKDPIAIIRNCTCQKAPDADPASFPAYANWPATFDECIAANDSAVASVLLARGNAQRFAFAFAGNDSFSHNAYWFVQPDGAGMFYNDTFGADPSVPTDDGYHTTTFGTLALIADGTASATACGKPVTYAKVKVVLDGADVRSLPSRVPGDR